MIFATSVIKAFMAPSRLMYLSTILSSSGRSGEEQMPSTGHEVRKVQS